ncbi:universal stress protein [Rhizobium sp. ZK1]|uniref:universal stress protein n=1 Tax=Rhizobium sp. ZK1 TaxID=3389872 RepID=UPI0039F6C7F2
MTFANILNIVKEDVTEAELDAAVILARFEKGHLSLLLVEAAEPPPVGVNLEFVSAPWQAENQKNRSRLLDRVQDLEATLTRKGISNDVECAYTEIVRIDNVVGEQAQLSDVAVIGNDILADPVIRDAVLDGLLFHAHVPVIVNPTAADKWEENTVLIAWTDAPAASAAVKASVPLLKRARSVRAVMVDSSGSEREVTAKLQSYLSHHGIDIVVDCVGSNGLTVAEALDAHADQMQSDLLVMGAYGHSRLRERIFGGVTRSMLERRKRPIFISA